MTISRTRFYKWLVSYAVYKFEVLPQEGRDNQGRWIIFRKKEDLETQSTIF